MKVVTDGLFHLSNRVGAAGRRTSDGTIGRGGVGDGQPFIIATQNTLFIV